MPKRSCDFYLAKVKSEVLNKLGVTTYQLDNMGLKIYTNLDPELQLALEAQKNSNKLDSEGSVAIIIDNSTGGVLAHCSTYPYEVKRQAGSALKPLAVYAPALDSRIVTLATPIVDEKVNFGGFAPDNYDSVYYGDTNVREAIKKSMNSVSVKILDYLGLDRSVEYLKNFGIELKSDDMNYALALGAVTVSPTQMAAAYSALANGGEYRSPQYVRYALKDGVKIIGEDRAGVKVVSNAAAALTTSALVDTVKSGTAKTLSALPVKVAAKTGTAQRTDGKNCDAWCASYTQDYTVLVWHGSDSGMTEKGGGKPALHALNIWKELNSKRTLCNDFSPCADIVAMDVDLYSTKYSRVAVCANENTPSEYRKYELFDINNLPNASQSRFTGCPKVDFEIAKEGNRIKLDFDNEEIYKYTLIRRDIIGATIIYEGNGDNSHTTLWDTPISFGGKVSYTLKVCLKNRSDIFDQCEKCVLL